MGWIGNVVARTVVRTLTRKAVNRAVRSASGPRGGKKRAGGHRRR